MRIRLRRCAAIPIVLTGHRIEAVLLTVSNPLASNPSTAGSLKDRSETNPADRDSQRIPETTGNGLQLLWEAPAAVRFWHLASLDAPTVAVVWSLAFAWVARMRLPLWVLALQALVVWGVYVGDRLLDARAGLRRACNELRERHYFHWRNRVVLAPMAVAAACAAVGIVLRWMPLGAGERDSVLAVASLAYFTRVHAGAITGELESLNRRVLNRRGVARRVLSKELLVGTLFTAGCALPAWSRAEWRVLAAPAMLFAALAWVNCAAIERWESRELPGRMQIVRMAIAIAAGGVGLAIVFAIRDPRAAALAITGTASALLLAWLDRRRERFASVTLRAAADLVLLTPAVLLAGAWLVAGLVRR